MLPKSIIQLNSILWKNMMLKQAHIWSFAAELFLPVVFMALLIYIKSVTDIYDSPAVAYYCGNAYPWYYNPTFDYTTDPQIPFTCTQKPLECQVDHYYQYFETYEYSNQKNVSGYTQYGKSNVNYMHSYL
jgi:hypothetical protein